MCVRVWKVGISTHVCEGMESRDQYTCVWVHFHVCEAMEARDQYWVSLGSVSH